MVIAAPMPVSLTKADGSADGSAEAGAAAEGSVFTLGSCMVSPEPRPGGVRSWGTVDAGAIVASVLMVLMAPRNPR